MQFIFSALMHLVDENSKTRLYLLIAVTWYKGVRELQYSKRHRIVSDGNHYMMQIRSTVQTDPGEYTVEAVNKFGRVRGSVWVNILPKREEE